MKNSIQIAKIRGIPLKLHWTFGLMMLWVIFEGRRNGMGWENVGWFALLIIGLFFCVILHELGHAVAAKRYGVVVKDIIISPIRGAARMDGLPDRPITETIIAAAGPSVNMVIAILIGIVGWSTGQLDFSNLGTSKSDFGNPENFFTLFFLINLMLVVFNIIPTFPLDGGRILRSLLALKIGKLRATRVTMYLSQFISIVIVVLAYYFLPQKILLYFIPFFVMMAGFLFFMSSREYETVKTEEILKNHVVAELIRSEFTSFQNSDNIAFAKQVLEVGKEKDFLVKNESGDIIGILAETTILENSVQYASSIQLIEKFISPILEVAQPSDSLFQFYKKLRRQQVRILPIFENEQLIGVLDVEQMNEFLRMRYDLR